ncbi:MAG: glycosyltransferase family 4 protein [Thermodesulfobacteriota bacterium]
MKLILVQPFGHRNGHYSFETWRLANTLLEKNLKLQIISFDGFIDKNESEIKESGFKHVSFAKNAGFFKKLIVRGVIRFLSLINYNRLISRWISIVETYFTLQLANEVYQNEDQDLIFCYDGELVGFLLYCANTNKKKIVHGRLEYGRTLSSNNVGRKVKRSIENWLCKKAINKNSIKFIYHVQNLEKSYENTGFLGECIHIPLFGIEESIKVIDKTEARNFLNLPKDITILLVFGIGHPGKNYETIVKAIKNLNGNCCVVFAGSSLPVNDAKYLSKKYNVEENTIIFDKYIPKPEHGYYFYSADYLLLSYKKEFVLDSGVLIEAIRYGVPVIASDAAWIGEMVETNGLGTTFTSEDPESLESAINKSLLLNEDEIEKIRTNMKELANKNSWENVIEKHLEIFQDTVEAA